MRAAMVTRAETAEEWARSVRAQLALEDAVRAAWVARDASAYGPALAECQAGRGRNLATWRAMRASLDECSAAAREWREACAEGCDATCAKCKCEVDA